jgi:hypothetical protein
MKGGYYILDASGVNLLAAAKATVAGIHAKAITALATGKPIIMYNCVYGANVPASPVPCFGHMSSTSVVLHAAMLEITIDNADGVTIVDNTPSSTENTTTAKRK